MFWKRFKKEENINWLQSMQKLEVKDGDIVVLKYGGKLSKTAYENLKKFIEETITGFGFKVNVIIFEEGMDIGVLTKKETSL